MDNRRIMVSFKAGTTNISLLESIITSFGVHQVSCLRVLSAQSLEIRSLSNDNDYLSPTSQEVANEWSYTSTLTYAFIACRGITLPTASLAPKAEEHTVILITRRTFSSARF